ncbi:MAG: hypothetical protein JJT76_14795 [Clostridiaceae bacterium]|nr:hypothetical protein [Clostridiaceae bacterium]
MEDRHKKKITDIVMGLIVLVLSLYIKNNFVRHDQFNNRMYYDFQDFGIALEEMNESISSIFILQKDSFTKEKSFMDRKALLDYLSSKRYAADRGNFTRRHEYPSLYREVDRVIDNILLDGRVSPSEERYLKKLYAYNEALIHAHREALGDTDDMNSEAWRNARDEIVTIYEEFSTIANDLIDSEEYSFLQDFKGDFEEVHFLRAKKFSEKVFSKAIPDQALPFDNREEKYTEKFIFSTHDDEDIRIYGLNEETQYKVLYHKGSREVTLYSWRGIIPSNQNTSDMYTEKELDALAEEILAKFGDVGFLYDRSVTIDLESKKLQSITYAYIQKIDDVYDEQQKVELTLTNYGAVSKLYIVDHDDIEMKLPLVSQEEILEKLSPDTTVQAIFKVRNLQGEMEYEVHILYEGTTYGVIFDGDTGGLKYYGRERRNYNQLNQREDSVDKIPGRN